MDTKQLLCDTTKKFWEYYLLSPSKEHFEKIFTACSQQLVMIGTGKHEFYVSFDQILKDMTANLSEAETIRFEILDEWYEYLELGADVGLVYGGLWARQQAEAEEKVLVDMDTRFSVLYRREADGWKIIHLHHSMPYFDQQSGEYYPRSLSQKAREALELAEEFQKKSELDLMTGVYNQESFRKYSREAMLSGQAGALYVFDLDHFKEVNDTYGHITGDILLKRFSGLLKKYFDGDIIGRIGGDEFAVYEKAPDSLPEDHVRKILSMEKEYHNEAEKILGEGNIWSWSVGIGIFRDDERSFVDLFDRVDKALYRAKHSAGVYCWSDKK
ncbi:diguanylate cyclase [Christensenella intestinihominis]|uniref:diguanylate cyclase n=1 Tax=Christensenella intestinihominis TaxID=1851429 RepID=UPI0008301387|nr:diguanylate cyclase [Christensenella intestinihominis]